MSEWVKVTDQLPETGAYIVAFLDWKNPISKEMVWYVTDGAYYSDSGLWYTGGETNHRISHWVPYPDPPEVNG